MSRLGFKLEATSPGTNARATTFTTLHGEVQTPIFMPVGTQATVKGQTVETLLTSGSNVLLANTYHLLLRPGPEVFKQFGGIHRFMNWKRPVLTDSGGFQIFSLPHSRDMKEEGASFRSYVDGKMHLLSPEVSIGMQRAIGSDIMMVLDQCVPSTVERPVARAAMELTHRWARRSLAAREDSPQSMFGIIQGACFRDLRQESAKVLTDMNFDGFAIGGLAVGETKAEREEFTEFTAGLMPKNLPRYLMGVGTPLDILEAVHRGVDMFDCIMPSALAQRGIAFTSQGKLQLRRTVYKFSEDKLDPDCVCDTCRDYSRAYLHHLYKAEEVLGWKLLANHNFTFYHRLMREMRASILEGRFMEFYRARRESLDRSDDDNPVTPPKRSRSRKPALALGDYEIHQSPLGFHSIRQLSSGEIMHSVSNPLDETDRLYIAQSKLAQRLMLGEGETLETATPLVIWDVGLGAATNAMGAVKCWEGVAQPRPLHIVSFENDLDSLRLAAKHPDKFPQLRHSGPYAILEKGKWASAYGRLTWELIEGRFDDKLTDAPAPDLIFYDLFSAKCEAWNWTVAAFEKMHRRCSARQAELYTYTSSTGARAAMLAGGFFVGKGASSGPISVTTVAFSRAEGARDLYGAEWIALWHRSGAKFPKDLEDAAKPAFEARILSHPQFASASG